MSETPTTSRRIGLYVVAGGMVALLVVVAGWWFWPRLPQPGSSAYEEYVEVFELGTAALDSGLVREAREKLGAAIERIPQEPAAWANRGLLYLRNNQLEEAAADLRQAQNLAPENADIEELLALVAEERGQVQEAIERTLRALKGSPDDVRRLYSLVRLHEKLGPTGDAERERLLDRILELRSTSLPILVERLQLAVRGGNRGAMQEVIGRMKRLAPGWQEKARQLLDVVEKEAAGKYDERDLIVRVGMLGNLLRGEMGFARSAGEINPDQQGRGTSLQQFLRLAPLRTEPSPADLELSFPARGFAEAERIDGKVEAVAVTSLDGEKVEVVAAAGGKLWRLGGKEKSGAMVSLPAGFRPTRGGILPIDVNNDLGMDLVVLGSGGVRFYEQRKSGEFEETTERTKLPQEVLHGNYHQGWAVDIDLEGDLDIVLAPREGAVVVLRNNGDGSFTPLPLFASVTKARGFCSGDLDADGAPEAIFLDAAGRLQVFMNERGGLFRARPVSEDQFRAATVADLNDDGVFDLIGLKKDRTLVRISDREKGKSWEIVPIARLSATTQGEPGDGELFGVDLDRNGAIDIVFRTREGGAAWLGDGRGGFTLLPTPVPPGETPPVALDSEGPLELFGVSPEGKPERWSVQGTKEYHWHRLRPRASPNGTGDQRINSFALGSEVELRSGSLIAKQRVTQPVVEFGLGTRKRVTLLRLVWTNGAAQFEFERPADEILRVEQRLKGSCPFLFSWDGEKMVFVSDFCWSTPLGLYINAQKRGGGFRETTEWIRIGCEQLRPREGYYDLRVNANLWETHYLDQLALQVIDHPADTEVYCDERFFLTPTKPRIYVTGKSQAVARAWDHRGVEVTDVIRARDGRYLDRAGRGVYQGVTQDHWVEVEPGELPAGEGPVYLVAQGWLHPTDSSINAALEQSSHARPQPLTLEIPDGQGGWKAALPPLGFPAGKNKTVIVRLDGLSATGVPGRIRLRTSMEIYWDALHLARGVESARILQKTLHPTFADLRYRGILKMTQADASSPEIPHYDQIEQIRQPWRDLIGFHTRFGDVKELLSRVDDRYVLLNAGDEIALRFAAEKEPARGWKRTFVWISDGWTKDGDLNTGFSKTVLPLPYHGMTGYERGTERLEDDPVYQRHARDWQEYHTRFVTPTEFERGLRPARRR